MAPGLLYTGMEEKQNNRATGVRVLVVDGDADTRRSISKQLSRRGCTVRESGSFIDASHAIRTGSYEVVLLDLTSLREEALLLIRVIKGANAVTRVILLINPEQIHLSIKGMQLGAFDDVMVPVDIDKLWMVIEAALNRGDESADKLDPGVSGGGSGTPADRDNLKRI